NLVLNEGTIVKYMRIERSDPIAYIASNFNSIAHPLPSVAAPALRDVERKNRKKARAETTRRRLGTGTEFNSSVCFSVVSPSNAQKIYKIKMFRTGLFDCLGVLRYDYADFLPAMRALL